MIYPPTSSFRPADDATHPDPQSDSTQLHYYTAQAACAARPYQIAVPLALTHNGGGTFALPLNPPPDKTTTTSDATLTHIVTRAALREEGGSGGGVGRCKVCVGRT